MFKKIIERESAFIVSNLFDKITAKNNLIVPRQFELLFEFE